MSSAQSLASLHTLVGSVDNLTYFLSNLYSLQNEETIFETGHEEMIVSVIPVIVPILPGEHPTSLPSSHLSHSMMHNLIIMVSVSQPLPQTAQSKSLTLTLKQAIRAYLQLCRVTRVLSGAYVGPLLVLALFLPLAVTTAA